ncbi:hypothetical protein AS180_21135 [Priestia veravalensis]|uniref:GmrSD restriction endonucleases N-terminal domain-containing protein n=1 Tax=Priestia veravalensis TaxID=1414648 RepID=A0A0V8JAW4_9BACI|nr:MULTISPECIES: DUF262 domain-containing protein [Priestia]KSU83976.1 hypothetical protein AS180_21135 [Priestia veravalensis]SCC59971.1 Protein of unknown function DUF262 [Priestia flexa]
MSLKDEINKKAKEIQADGYPMSIGELINMYKDEELVINPEFQRFFRWTDIQKTKLIESILLGIPIPPIFVSQRDDGVWDVIDGLQRLSTIMEFVDELRLPPGKEKRPLKLLGTKFLPSLENKVWNDISDPDNSFTSEQRIDFKRSKMDIKIIKKASDKDAKYELFQRINTGGTKLEPQEVRNCLLIMVDRDFYLWAARLKENQHFQNCIPLTEKQYLEQYDMEIFMRYLVYRHADFENIKGSEDMAEFITDEVINLIENKKIDYDQEEQIFIKTFEYLDNILSEDSFRKYDYEKQKFKGAFSLAAFETIVGGISENIDSITAKEPDQVVTTIKNIYNSSSFLSITSGSSRPIIRVKELSSLGRNTFGQ